MVFFMFLICLNEILSLETLTACDNHCHIRSSSFFLLIFLIVLSITCFGYLASVYLLLILFVSSSKSAAIILALCSSPVIAFLLYLKGTFEDQCTGSFFTLLSTCILIPWSVRIIYLDWFLTSVLCSHSMSLNQ